MECLCKDEAAMRESVAAFSALWNASGRFWVQAHACARTDMASITVGSVPLPLDKPMFYLLDQIDTDHLAKQRAIQAWFKQEPAGFLK